MALLIRAARVLTRRPFDLGAARRWASEVAPTATVAESPLAATPEVNTVERQITQEADKLYDSVLKPLDHFRYMVPRKRSSLPMVLILGNHSSGKSTFINYLLGEREQDTGLAPTDDGFTVITTQKGVEGYNQDGNALVSTASWGFADLERFGPRFASKVRLKVRPARPTFPEGILLVDTPGTIDAIAEGSKARDASVERGYDFLQSVTWFAERSDVILLFFDPNNPGTTRETLEVLTGALGDMDYKLLIVLNKVDQFQLVHDFARAYGSLCWNLAKVIPRKDLPKIFSMFVPTEENKKCDETGVNQFGLPMKDFIAQRRKVIDEVMSAPKRRIDNLLTRLNNTARRLKMMAVVAEQVRSEYKAARNRSLALTSGLSLTALAAAAAGTWFEVGWETVLALSMMPAGGALATAFMSRSRLQTKKSELIANLTKIFESKYYLELEDDTQSKELRDMWESIRPRLARSLEMRNLSDASQVPKLKKAQLAGLNTLLDKEIPRLRKEYEEQREK